MKTAVSVLALACWAGSASAWVMPGSVSSAAAGIRSIRSRLPVVATPAGEKAAVADPAAERAAVMATTQLWLDTVTGQKETSPAETAALYADDAVLWGTVSEQVRATPKDIRDYFDFFAKLPGLSVLDYNPYCRVFGDVASNCGDYIFAWNDADGKLQPKKARFSFYYRKDPKSPTGWKIIDHHSSAMPSAPEGLPAAMTGDERSVRATTDLWLQTVTGNKPESPAATAALYAEDAVLWGTVSEQVRATSQDIRDYFDFFAALPGLSVLEYNPYIRVFGDIATSNGDYIFAWNDAEGNLVPKKARYTFMYRREKSSPTGWQIIDHHSSAMPEAPAALKPAGPPPS